MAEIIDIALSDDDDIIQITSPITAKNKKFKCLNADCQSEKDLIKATIAVRRFYGVLSFPKKIKVCARCSAYAKIKAESTVDAIRRGKLLLNISGPENRNTIVLTDSDSDLTDNDSDSEDSLFEIDSSEMNFEIHDETEFSYEDIKRLLSDITDELGLKKQIEEGSEKINARLVAAEEGFKSLNDEYKTIENNLDRLRNKFYDSFKLGIKWLPALEIGPSNFISNNSDVTEVIAETPIHHQNLNLPPIGQLIKHDLKPNDLTYSIKYSLFAKWVLATIISCDSNIPNSKMYTICYSKNINQSTGKRTVSARNLAYYNPCPTRIPVGTRIVAKYREEIQKCYSSGFYFVGIVAEIPTVANKYRYLIFFDDGYAQYVNHLDIRVVVESSPYPWEDVATDSREFIKDYLHTYPERPMVRLQKTNFIKTEWNGRWWKAQVLEVDASLVKMYFPIDGRTEWIYRGSTRLSPLFNKKLNIQSQVEQPKVIRRRTLPIGRSGHVVEYVNFGQGNENFNSEEPKLSETTMSAPLFTAPVEKRAVARKSTSGRPGTPPLEVQEQIFQESRGFVKRKLLKGTLPVFKPHQCSRICNLNNYHYEVCSPLLKPMLESWRRLIIKERKKTVSRNSVTYIAPCGRHLRSIEEVFRFLRITQSDLEIDFFSFDLGVEPTSDWEPAKKNLCIVDISNGIEQMPVSCVNSLDNSNPQPLIYCNVRLPTENVNLNLDPSFLVCCSCTDDCQDKSLCECWQLTIEAGQLLSGKSTQNLDMGYKFRRLHEQVATGIFECNHLCSCNKTCLNRVVQHPIRQRLQLFKTAKRGWGVRTLHDIPQGAFICVYVGKVLSEAVANQEGKLTSGGDDYYAELDFIEVVDGMKEGYESDVDEEDASMDESDSRAIDSTSDKESSTEEAEPEKDDVMPLIRGTYNIDKDFSISSVSTLHPRYLQQRKPSARIKARVGQSESCSNEVSSKSRSNSPNIDMEVDSVKQGEDVEDDDEVEDIPARQPQTFEPLQMTAPPSRQYKPLRELFGEDEAVYIMDAKVTGNIGRYFNHSCQPNVFVQNVFVDTHDLRFPWVSFFASTRIRSGVELTWDYNYEVGSVPGKIKYCYCMAKKCRGRLL